MNRKTYTAQGLYLYLISVGAKQTAIDAARVAFEEALLEEQGQRAFTEVFRR